MNVYGMIYQHVAQPAQPAPFAQEATREKFKKRTAHRAAPVEVRDFTKPPALGKETRWRNLWQQIMTKWCDLYWQEYYQRGMLKNPNWSHIFHALTKYIRIYQNVPSVAHVAEWENDLQCPSNRGPCVGASVTVSIEKECLDSSSGISNPWAHLTLQTCKSKQKLQLTLWLCQK